MSLFNSCDEDLYPIDTIDVIDATQAQLQLDLLRGAVIELPVSTSRVDQCPIVKCAVHHISRILLCLLALGLERSSSKNFPGEHGMAGGDS